MTKYACANLEVTGEIDRDLGSLTLVTDNYHLASMSLCNQTA